MSVQFNLIKRLGSGYFGEVWRAKEIGLGQECAVKLVPHTKIVNQGNFFQEAQCLKAAEHPNVVKIIDTGAFDGSRIYLSMEFLPSGSLEDEASGGVVALTRAKRLMVDVLRGLEYAHSNNVLHRDIKPANILIGNASEGKLSDFGLAVPDMTTLDLTVIKTHYQYFYHLAPEVSKFTDYTTLSDIFACGITFYRLINGDSYLPSLAPPLIRSAIAQGKYPDRTRYRDFIPQNLRTFTNKAMNVDPTKRFQSAAVMRHALEQIALVNNWTETVLTNGTHWTSSHKNGIHVVEKTFSKGTWTVETSRGKEMSSLKRVIADCGYGMTKNKADIFARKILQKFTAGRK